MTWQCRMETAAVLCTNPLFLVLVAILLHQLFGTIINTGTPGHTIPIDCNLPIFSDRLCHGLCKIILSVIILKDMRESREAFQFQFSDRLDKLLLVLGIIGACLVGASVPAQALLFWDMMDSVFDNKKTNADMFTAL